MKSLIDIFTDTLEPACESPKSYLHWAGAALVASLMGRQVWTNIRADTAEDRLFGNLFILIIGEPGTGKNMPIKWSRRLSRDHGVRVGPDDITGERLIHYCKTFKWAGDSGKDEILEKKQRGKKREDTSEQPKGTVAIFLSEFEHLFHQGNSNALKRTLTDFYDCREEAYERQTYQHGEQVVEKMCMTLVGGCTPSHMGKIFLRDEWQEGLPSRFIYVWGSHPGIREEFSLPESAQRALTDATGAVREYIADRMFVGWSPKAKAARLKWRRANIERGPPHPLLIGYNTRRHVSIAKTAFVHAVSRCAGEIELADWQEAEDRISQTEKEIHKALAQAGGNEFRAIMTWSAVWIAERKHAPEFELRRKLGQQIPPQYIDVVIDEMVASRLINAGGQKPTRVFRAGEKEKI